MDAIILTALLMTTTAFMSLGFSFKTVTDTEKILGNSSWAWIGKSPNLKNAFLTFGAAVLLCAIWGMALLFKEKGDFVFLSMGIGWFIMLFIPKSFLLINLSFSIAATVLAIYSFLTKTSWIGKVTYTYEIVAVFNLLLYLFIFVAWLLHKEKK